ncbi:hypothetical protein D3C87_1891500 [compost metagenome]
MVNIDTFFEPGRLGHAAELPGIAAIFGNQYILRRIRSFLVIAPDGHSILFGPEL